MRAKSQEVSFTAIVDEVARDFYEGIFDGSSLPNQDLTTLVCRNFVRQCQCVFMIVFRSFNDYPDTMRKAEAIIRLVWATDLDILERMYYTCRQRDLIAFFLWLLMEEAELAAELERRGSDKTVGLELLKSDAMVNNVSRLEKLLRIDHDLKSYWPNEQDSADIKQAGWEKALEVHRSEAQKFKFNDSAPDFPIPMSAAEKKVWEEWFSKAWDKRILDVRSSLLATLNGVSERIPAKVRHDRRETWRKIKRRKKIMEGTGDFPKDGPEGWRASWDWKQPGQDYRSSEIAAEVHSELYGRADRTTETSSRMLMVLKTAKKRWGNKAVKALQLFMQGKTEKEAAELAGITPRTLRNYVSRLKKDLSQKK